RLDEQAVPPEKMEINHASCSKNNRGDSPMTLPTPRVRDFKLGFSQPQDYGRAREVLAAAGYTDDGVPKVLGVDAITCQSRDNKHKAAFLRQTQPLTPVNQLIRLFLLSASVPLKEAQAAVAPMGIEPWVAAGLLAVENDRVRALVKLIPFGDFWIAHDPPMLVGRDAQVDYVMGIGGSTLTVAGVTLRRPSRNSLDLGAGCGIHALLAAPHSERVSAVDRNPRATVFAAFNAALNGLNHVTCLTGDRFEPVADQSFDLIVSNPPFVIGPRAKYIYRDSGLFGDEFCQSLVRHAPAVLAQDGYCQFLFNWAHYKDQPWQERLPSWFEGTGCDALVLRTYTTDPSDYALSWINRNESMDPANISETYNQWMEFFDQHGIEAISAGIITMRKSSRGSNWVVVDDGPKKLLGDCGWDLELVFKLRDYLHDKAAGNDALLNTALRVHPSVRFNHQFNPAEGRWVDSQAEVCRVAGLAYTAGVDSHITKLISGCDGSKTLRELASQLAASLGRDMDAVAPHVCMVVRGLMERAFLVPVGVRVMVPSPAEQASVSRSSDETPR
ncbi:MAG: methyltransferase, partial [Planctomycetaceae bacterium]|nr:methyltransferase [Planctomycetaceae bacterium]